NPADIEVITETLRAKRGDVVIDLARDGQHALDMLQQAPPSFERRPNLVILDLNLPKIGGREVLQTIRGAAELRHIPVVIISSSASEKEIMELYSTGANAYVIKPMHHGDFIQLLDSVASFWLCAATIPS